MTPVRALIAGLLAAVFYGAGLFIAASLAGGRPHDLIPFLSLSRTPFEIWCFLEAWGALVLGVLGVLAAFLAFIAPEEEDDPRYRRRGFPKGLPIFLIALGLGLAFLALRCGTVAAAPIAVPIAPSTVEPAAAAEPAEPLPVAAAVESHPVVGAASAAFQWRYMDPLVRDAHGVFTADARPFADEAEAERLLCGMAWVAVSGSASEEGPADRNAARARMRTERAMAQAAAFLARRADCGQTVVLGLDLGQHVSGAAGDDAGVSTAYQRQILIVSRRRVDGEAALSAAAARAELLAFLGVAANRDALLSGRAFRSDPVIVLP